MPAKPLNPATVVTLTLASAVQNVRAHAQHGLYGNRRSESMLASKCLVTDLLGDQKVVLIATVQLPRGTTARDDTRWGDFFEQAMQNDLLAHKIHRPFLKDDGERLY